LEFEVPPTPWFRGADLARGLGVASPVAHRVALFGVGKGSTWFEILEYGSPPSTSSAAPAQNEIGAAHVAIHVDDIHDAYERLAARGVVFNSGINVIDEGPLAGWRWVYFRDPDGHTIELVEVVDVDEDQRAIVLREHLEERAR
jgi:catechol 2,3-dioxygenase-like lactoylglutathione lyase family enzyme